MKTLKTTIIISLLSTLILTGSAFSKYYDADGKPSEKKLEIKEKSFYKFWERGDKKFGSLSFTLGGGWQQPFGNLYDLWKGGVALNIGLDFWLLKYLSVGSHFNLIDWDGSSGAGVDTSSWDANIYNLSFLAKGYAFDKLLFVGGGYGISWMGRTIPNIDDLNATIRSRVEGDSRHVAIAQVGTIIWDFFQVAATYSHTFSEGDSFMFNLSLFM